MEKCQQFLPNGGEPRELDPEQVEQARKMAKCMRENGVPDFPDPQADGTIKLDGSMLGGKGPDDPTFKAAMEKCEQYAPKMTAEAASDRRPDCRPDADPTPTVRPAAEPRRRSCRLPGRRRRRSRTGAVRSPRRRGRRRRRRRRRDRLRRRTRVRPRQHRATGNRPGHPADAGRHADRRRRAGVRRPTRTASRASGRHGHLAAADRGDGQARGSRCTAVDNAPVVLLYGSAAGVPDAVSPGSRATDVKQFEQNLRALGYSGFTVDDEYTGSTADAVREWQDDLGLAETGTVEPGRVVYAGADGAGRRARGGGRRPGAAGPGGADLHRDRPGWSPSTSTSPTSGWPRRAPRSA